MDLAVAILTDPERPLCPRESRVATAAGRRDRGQHMPSLGIDLLNPILGKLIEVLAVERGSRMAGDVNRAHYLPAVRIECLEGVARGNPDLGAVVRDSVHTIHTREGS